MLACSASAPDTPAPAQRGPPQAGGTLAFVQQRDDQTRTCIHDLQTLRTTCPEALLNAYPGPADPTGRALLITNVSTGEPHRERLALWTPERTTPLSNWMPSVRTPQWQADGSTLVFAGGAVGATVVLKTDRQGVLQTIDTHPSGDFEPTISPSGEVVFVSSRTGDAELHIAGKQAKALTASPGVDGRPLFSPDGTQIAWLRTHMGNPSVWIGNGTGLIDAHSLMEGNRSVHHDMVWSPDGRSLAVVVTHDGAHAIVDIVRVSDGTRTGRFEAHAPMRDPAWSPDSRWLAATVEAPAGAEIWTSHRSGRDLNRVATGEGDAWLPRWQVGHHGSVSTTSSTTTRTAR